MRYFAGKRRAWPSALAAATILSSLACTARGADPTINAQAPAAACPDRPVLPIDLLTALRLVNDNNPTVAVARARLREAYARVEQADVLWLPTLQTGPTYLRHDGQIQNARGDVFTTSKSSIFIGGGAAMRFELADALFAPLIANRLSEAEAARTRAVVHNTQLEAAEAYLDLLRAYGALAINADTLARASEMMRRAEAASKAGLSKTTADLPRARTEVQLRLQERIRFRGDVTVASARLVRLLLLQPCVILEPADCVILPVTLVDACSCEDLVATGLLNRPELAARRSLVQAAIERTRQAKLAPLIPRVELTYYSGGFGGGQNSFIGNFNGRGDGTAQMVWELRNLGFGYRAENRVREAQTGEANFQLQEEIARVTEEVVVAADVAYARRESLPNAQEAILQALEMWRRLERASFGMAGPRGQYDALEPLLAEQALNTARVSYLNDVIEYNRAQFRLYTALGQPPLEALPKACPVKVNVPVVPSGKIDTEPLPAPRPLQEIPR